MINDKRNGYKIVIAQICDLSKLVKVIGLRWFCTRKTHVYFNIFLTTICGWVDELNTVHKKVSQLLYYWLLFSTMSKHYLIKRYRRILLGSRF